MALEQIIEHYGYVAVFIGTFLEGEIILIVAGFLAHQGYLHLPLVIAAAFLGTLAADQLFYYLGRYRSAAILKRFPIREDRIQKVKNLIKTYRVIFILGFRFTYGLRTVSPFVIGMSNVSSMVYTPLNIVSALAWAIVIGTGGYYFGHAMEKILGDVKQVELEITGGIVVIAGCFWLYHLYRNRVKKNKMK